MMKAILSHREFWHTQAQHNPTALWTMTETSGSTVYDTSGFGRNASFQRTGMSGQTQWRDQVAPSFPGNQTNGYGARTGDSTLSSHAGASGTWSMDVMLYDAGTSGNRVILSCSTFPLGGYEFFIYRTSAGLLSTNLSTSNGVTPIFTAITTTKPADNTWYHFGVTYNRATPRVDMYVNGTSVANATSMTGTSSFTSTPWFIGARGDSTGDRWSGRMSHMAIYPTELTSTQMLYHARAAGVA
jgi:hypothetical protein